MEASARKPAPRASKFGPEATPVDDMVPMLEDRVPVLMQLEIARVGTIAQGLGAIADTIRKGDGPDSNGHFEFTLHGQKVTVTVEDAR